MAVDYFTYIRSPAWRKRRNAYVKGRRSCENCFKPTGRFDVHHLTYDSLGNESDAHLIAVCRKCHLILHGRAGRRKARRHGQKKGATYSKGIRRARRAGVAGSLDIVRLPKNERFGIQKKQAQ